MRKIQFENNEYYHIYNRGVDKREIFQEQGDYLRFVKYLSSKEARPSLKRLSLFNSISLICYSLNPNHFHLLIRQLQNEGVSDFMHWLMTSYSMFFNTKYQRSGALFQGPFKAKLIDFEEYLVLLSVYINANPFIHGLTKNIKQYPWSSYGEYLGLSQNNYCDKDLILKLTGDYERTASEVMENMQYEKILKYIIE